MNLNSKSRFRSFENVILLEAFTWLPDNFTRFWGSAWGTFCKLYFRYKLEPGFHFNCVVALGTHILFCNMCFAILAIQERVLAA